MAPKLHVPSAAHMFLYMYICIACTDKFNVLWDESLALYGTFNYG